MHPNDNARERARRKLAALALMALAVGGIQTSCTPPPQCAPGQHAQRAPSHQGKVWQCVDTKPAS